MRSFLSRYRSWVVAAFFFVIGALLYLPLVGKFGYYNDDWYLMYSAGAYGPRVFQSIFSVDRPGRVFVMIPAYELFGRNPLYYSLSAFVFRVVGALALLWTLNLLWPKRRSLTTATALLFLMYPGFLSQPNAIDYQSHIVGLAAALLSVSLTLKAVLSSNRLERFIFHVASILFGWLSLSQMEWYIGFEFFRWACVFILSSKFGDTVLQRGIRAIRWAYPSLLVPVIFLVWRLFFFVSARGATDVDLQLGLFRLYPVQTVYHWTIRVFQDLYRVVLTAWIVPLFQLRGYIQAWSFVLSVLIIGLILVLLYQFQYTAADDVPEKPAEKNEILLLGLLTAIVGLIPIVMVNRDVSFPVYSRYSLVSSAGAVIFIVGLIDLLPWRITRYLAFVILAFIATLTHHANAAEFAQETAVSRDFWWQVTWRIPQLQPRTTLIGNYPVGIIEEDYFIWGPANLIYYPEKQTMQAIQPAIFAAVLNKETVAKVLAKERQEFDNRKTIITYKNYRNILILSQPTLSSCMHVIDGTDPEFSTNELNAIRSIGAYSEIEHVLPNETPHTPPTIVFGPEPDHSWCYYYQKADLARQREDWEEVLQLANEAAKKGLKPADLIEWLPFLQAYALNGKTDELNSVMKALQPDDNVLQQACEKLQSLPKNADIQNINSQYCVSPK